jgi:hypothetical protein
MRSFRRPEFKRGLRGGFRDHRGSVEEAWTPLSLESVLLMYWLPWEATPASAPSSARAYAQNEGILDNEPLEYLTEWKAGQEVRQIITSERALYREEILGDLPAAYFDGDDVYSAALTLGYYHLWCVTLGQNGGMLYDHNGGNDVNNKGYWYRIEGGSHSHRITRGGVEVRSLLGSGAGYTDVSGAVGRGDFVSGEARQYGAGVELDIEPHALAAGSHEGPFDTMGRSWSGSNRSSGYLVGQIVADDTITPEEITQLEEWLEAQTGLTAVVE